MSYTTLQLLRPFYEKINELYSQYVSWRHSCTKPFYCDLCDDEIKGLWNNHARSRAHLKCLNVIAEQLIDVFFPPGIVMQTKKECGACIFCRKLFPNFFCNLNVHLNDPNHQVQVNAYKMKFDACNFSAIHEVCCISANDGGNDIVRKIICSGMRVATDGELVCSACNFHITDEEQFFTHIVDSDHVTWVITQLCTAAVKIEFHRGVTIKDKEFFCLICRSAFGSGLTGANNISFHLEVCHPIAEVSSLKDNDSTPSGDNVCKEQLKRVSSSSLDKKGSSLLEEDKCMEQPDKDSTSSNKESSSPLAENKYHTETSVKDPPASE